MKTIWNLGARKIEWDLDKMQFNSTKPWQKTEIDALWTIPAIYSVNRLSENLITVYPNSPPERQMAIYAVLAVAMIHEEGVCAI